tara:strand:- start:81 stop:686 length:606 start_codon:yes stop_codon:yes gene_type:complete
VEQGVSPVFQIPMAQYENKDLISELKDFILSKDSQGIESNVAPLIKQNLIESKFNFFQDETPIVRKTAQWIASCLKKTINTIQMEDVDYNFVFNESWYHITKTNGMHEPHTHPRCSWCGIYYIQSGDGDSGHTVFENPTRSTYVDRGNLYLNNMSTIRVKAEDGKLIFFPSFLSHYQSLYEGTKDRIIVAFNISVNKREEV